MPTDRVKSPIKRVSGRASARASVFWVRSVDLPDVHNDEIHPACTDRTTTNNHLMNKKRISEPCPSWAPGKPCLHTVAAGTVYSTRNPSHPTAQQNTTIFVTSSCRKRWDRCGTVVLDAKTVKIGSLQGFPSFPRNPQIDTSHENRCSNRVTATFRGKVRADHSHRDGMDDNGQSAKCLARLP